MRAFITASVLLWLCGVAAAQPTTINVSGPTTDAAGATFTVTWEGGGSFAWRAAYSDGSASVQGTSASPLALAMPYHASGQAAPGFVCVVDACAGLTVPAKPIAVTTLTASFVQPALNWDMTTPLTDLAAWRLYWKVDGGAESVTEFLTMEPTGGRPYTLTWDVPYMQGTLTAQIAARDFVGNESPRSAVVSKVIGAATPPPPPPPPPAAAPVIIKTVSRCSLNITWPPPDTSGGWTMQLRSGTTNLGSKDSTPPYQRTVEVTAGARDITARWMKGTTVQTSKSLRVTCP